MTLTKPIEQCKTLLKDCVVQLDSFTLLIYDVIVMETNTGFSVILLKHHLVYHEHFSDMPATTTVTIVITKHRSLYRRMGN